MDLYNLQDVVWVFAVLLALGVEFHMLVFSHFDFYPLIKLSVYSAN